MDLSKQAYRAKQQVNLTSLFVNLALSVAKLIGGIVGHSQALIADALHSVSDLATDVVVIIATRLGHAEADEDHPYGHTRFETVATLVLALLLIAAAIGIIVDAVGRLFDPSSLLVPRPLALIIAAISILANEGLFQYSIRVAKKWRSTLIKANAWHHRSDAWSSVIVLLGIAGSMAGLTYLDAVGAILVAVMIAKIGWDLGWPSMRELVDTGVEPARLAAIRISINEVEGVEALHLLRTRRMGENVLVDVHIVVAPKVSVSEGHQIAERVRHHVIRSIDEVTDVTVHIDPEDDGIWAPDPNLPTRDALLKELRRRWAPLDILEHIERIDLHYLKGQISVDVIVRLDATEGVRHAKDLAGDVTAAVDDLEFLRTVKVFYC